MTELHDFGTGVPFPLSHELNWCLPLIGDPTSLNLQDPSRSTLGTLGGSSLLRSGQNLGKTQLCSSGEGLLPPPYLRQYWHHTLTGDSVAQYSQLTGALPCQDWSPGRIWGRLNRVALAQGPLLGMVLPDFRSCNPADKLKKSHS